MPSVSESTVKRETLNLRIRPDARGLIDRAALVRGNNRTDFILDAARQAAEAIGIRGMAVQALSPQAKAFYGKVGF